MVLSTPRVSGLNGDPDAIINIHRKEIYNECFVCRVLSKPRAVTQSEAGLFMRGGACVLVVRIMILLGKV